MRKLLLGSAAAMVIVATPAVAKDGSGYFGGDIGIAWPKNQHVDGEINFTSSLVPDVPFGDVGDIDMKSGLDADLIGGYDFGMFRLEGEIGYKHGRIDQLDVTDDLLDAINDAAETTFTEDDFDIDNKTNVWSGMINGWLDFGGNDGVGGGIGGGVGYASVHQFGDSHGTFAWQLLAQV